MPLQLIRWILRAMVGRLKRPLHKPAPGGMNGTIVRIAVLPVPPPLTKPPAEEPPIRARNACWWSPMLQEHVVLVGEVPAFLRGWQCRCPGCLARRAKRAAQADRTCRGK